MINYRLFAKHLFGATIYCIVTCAGGAHKEASASDPLPKAPEGKAVKEKSQAPMVYIGVMANYRLTEKLPTLVKALDYAIGMATQFEEIGYEVRFVTESGSLRKAKQELKGKISVEEINSGDALMKNIQLWINNVAEKQPPVAILVLSGHGEERIVFMGKDKPGRKSAVFLSREDTPGLNEVSVDDISKAAARHGGVPTVIIYDACRRTANQIIISDHTAIFTAGIVSSFMVQTIGKPKLSLNATDVLPSGVTFVDNHDGTATLAGKPNESEHGCFSFSIIAESDKNTQTQIFTLLVRDKNAATGAGPMGTAHVRKASRSETGNPFPTILYSTVSGESAFDEEDLIWNLTNGLKWDTSMQQFLLWFQKASSSGQKVADKTSETSKPTEITLYHWFCIGLSGMLRSHKVAQSHEIVVSDGTPLSTSLYRVKSNIRMPPERTQTEIDLTEDCILGKGDFKASFQQQSGLLVTRPKRL